ncbi:hypothetical protein [Microbulbifer yueqingensis]|nr:hypothetical protein [Microbulbifer yueqingensis]
MSSIGRLGRPGGGGIDDLFVDQGPVGEPFIAGNHSLTCRK